MNTKACDDTILTVKNLKTWFPIKRGIFARTVQYIRAVDGVSLTVNSGETVGLVGESGCGKTTLGRTLLGLAKPISGEVTCCGVNPFQQDKKSLKAYRGTIQIIFQDPVQSLNPRMNILDIVTEGLVEFHMVEGDKISHAIKLLNAVGLDKDALFRYPHEFSGGQRQRISIARALSLRPRFIVCDEPVSALDVSVQAQVINLLISLRKEHGLSYLFISHDLSVVRNIAHRIAVMYLGKIVETAPTDDIIQRPRHPYTRALISAIPEPGKARNKRIVLQGEIPSPAAPPPGCRFHTRCPEAMTVCKEKEPLPSGPDTHRVYCHLYQPE